MTRCYEYVGAATMTGQRMRCTREGTYRVGIDGRLPVHVVCTAHVREYEASPRWTVVKIVKVAS